MFSVTLKILNHFGKITQVHEKFRLDLNDEDAGKFFQALITESVSALFPQIAETIHRWAQYWRA